MAILDISAALRVPPAPPADAAAYFAARLSFAADVSDVHASLASGRPGFVLVDSRDEAAWRQGHVPGAVHLPTLEIAGRAEALLGKAMPVITYCWGPGCDGAVRAALALARLGYRVKEMIGGIEYWIREGFPVETAAGVRWCAADPLTAPIAGPGELPAGPGELPAGSGECGGATGAPGPPPGVRMAGPAFPAAPGASACCEC